MGGGGRGGRGEVVLSLTHCVPGDIPRGGGTPTLPTRSRPSTQQAQRGGGGALTYGRQGSDAMATMGPFEAGFMDDSGGGSALAMAGGVKTAASKFEMVARKAGTEDYMAVATKAGVTCKPRLVLHPDNKMF
jgi:hypothetical protein